MRRLSQMAVMAVGTTVMAAVLFGCGPGSAATIPPKASTPPPSPYTSAVAPSGPASPSETATSGAIIVTLEVAGGERFRVELDEPADINIARTLFAGGTAPSIPDGRIVRGANAVNTGHDWTLDPADFDWADATAEACDGRPSDVDHPDTWLVARFCPWTAKVVAIDARS